MRRRLFLFACTAILAGSLTACTTAVGEDVGAGSVVLDSDYYDDTVVHSIEVTFDETEYEQMLQTFAETGEKDWISATVVIDGVSYSDVGMKLKGNSSLQGLAEAVTGDASTTGAGGMSDLSPEDPAGLPWRIKLDEYVDGQDHDGEADFVVRGNRTETSLNEAVALALLEESGLAAQAASATRLSVNGSDEALVLVVQNPDDQSWYESEIGGEGLLFKAQSGGDYSYRGDAAEDYEDVFDLEANTSSVTNQDAFPLLGEFLQFVNDSDDETFSAELSDHLDVDAFARYLAFEDILGNEDDIDGPGNNSYLSWDESTGVMTVVAWDHNLALGASLDGGGRGPAGEQGEDADQQAPEDMEPPEGMEPPGAGEAGQDGPGGGNVLAERFLADEAFAALVEEQRVALQEELIDSGVAASVLQDWTTTLTHQANDLVDAETIAQEADAVAQALNIEAA